MTALWFLLGVSAYLWVFWGLYVLVMGLYRAHLANRLTRFTYILSAPFLLVGYMVDVLTQFTVATAFFLDPPRNGEWLVTDRLKRYVAEGQGWRYDKARFVCDHLLDVFDPTGNHC